MLKLATSVLSLESELDIDVSAQNKLEILLFPKQILLLPVVILPDGAFDLPESAPIQMLLFPVVISLPDSIPTTILEFPVVRTWQDSIESGVLLNIGGNIIELFSKTGNKDNKKFFGNCSFSLRVKDVLKLHDKFSRKNITIGSLENNSWGDTSFTVSDIEGNQITFFTPNFSYNKYYKVKIN